MGSGMMTEPELVVGEIRGYRTFAVDEWGRLEPIIYVHRKWVSFAFDVRTHQAICIPASTLVRNAPHPYPARHSAPDVDCRCGLYAVYEAPGLVRLRDQGYAQFSQLSSGTQVLASVSMSGVVIKGDKGVMRAQKMTLEALATLTPDQTPAELLLVARNYQLPLIAFETLLDQYPLEDVTAEARHQDHYVVQQWTMAHRMHEEIRAAPTHRSMPVPMVMRAYFQAGGV